jgi:tRNA A37 threonylcarbamoyladenosine biosynthesis protein TsaE
MSNTEEFKKYLLEKENPFLLDEKKEKNNGKTIMISGAWGAGKTHFWQEEIEPELSEKLKDNNKACVYVSLYGK